MVSKHMGSLLNNASADPLRASRNIATIRVYGTLQVLCRTRIQGILRATDPTVLTRQRQDFEDRLRLLVRQAFSVGRQRSIPWKQKKLPPLLCAEGPRSAMSKGIRWCLNRLPPLSDRYKQTIGPLKPHLERDSWTEAQINQ